MHGCNTLHKKQIRNYKTGKNKIRDKKEKRDKARRTMYLRHCCVGGKNMVGLYGPQPLSKILGTPLIATTSIDRTTIYRTTV